MENIGYQWLRETFSLRVVQPLAVESRIGKTRATFSGRGSVRHETYPESYRPGNVFAEQMTFALKHEGIHLELLSRLFAIPQVRQELETWFSREPTGAYARRACFLHEWLHPELPLNVAGCIQGNYVNALAADDFLAGTPVNNARWRVRDNFPGTCEYCPMVRKTAAVKAAEQYDLMEKIDGLENAFGVDLLRRSAVWLTVKESKASFQLEHEQDKEDRIRRFAAVMEAECGAHDNPMSAEVLATLQHGILGDSALRYGPRKSPVYVGHDAQYRAVVDYVAPHWNSTDSMLNGLAEFMRRTVGGSPVIRSAVASFGFVYIHPMADGNGRISRFLINDTLRRDGAILKPFIIPVSATIAESPASRADYDRVLEGFSQPLMTAYAEDYHFGETVTGEDGVEYNFHFEQYDDALPAWRYPDLTTHVEYLATVIDETLTHEMRREALFLKANDLARENIKAFLEAPDNELDGIIRSVRQSNNALSNRLKKKYAILDDASMGDRVVESITTAFADVDKDAAAFRSSSSKTAIKKKKPSTGLGFR